jgi:hypothetical protein
MSPIFFRLSGFTGLNAPRVSNAPRMLLEFDYTLLQQHASVLWIALALPPRDALRSCLGQVQQIPSCVFD